LGFDAVLILFSLLNFPAMLVVAVILGLLDPTAVWLRLLIGSFAMWSGNYLVVRLAEWRAWAHIPIELHLLEKAQDPPAEPNSHLSV
jgi:hypothetical protein